MVKRPELNLKVRQKELALGLGFNLGMGQSCLSLSSIQPSQPSQNQTIPMPNNSLKRTGTSVEFVACRLGAASNKLAPSAQAPNVPSA